MQSMTLLDCFNEYASQKQLTSRQKKLAASLLGLTEKPAKYALSSNEDLLKLLHRKISEISTELSEVLPMAIHESLVDYSSKKQPAIQIYLELLAFLEHKYGISIPPDLLGSLESPQNRDWSIIRMSCENQSIEDIAASLLTSEHTIRADIRRMNHDGFLFIDRNVAIHGMDVKHGQLTFESTPHPVLLMGNLLQVITLLESLRQYEQKQDTQIAGGLALTIWRQMSDYARKTVCKRIRDVVINSDIAWYERLDRQLNQEPPAFQSELKMTASHLPDRLLMVFKGGEPCKLDYRNESGTVVSLPHAHVVHLYNDSADFAYDLDGQDCLVNIQLSQIIRCDPLLAAK